MKSIATFIFCALFTLAANSQSIEIKFSKEPFDVNNIEKSPISSDFTDKDKVYGIIIIDQDLKYIESDLERKWDDISISYSVFTGKEVKGGRDSYFKVEKANNKTYVFVDIYPDVNNTKSRSVKSMGYQLTKIESGKKGKFTITSIEGKSFGLPKTKIKKGSFSYKFTGGIASVSELEGHLNKCEENAKKQYSAYQLELRSQKNDAQEELLKKSGKIPNSYLKEGKTKKIPFSSISQDEFVQIIKNNSKLFNEGDVYLGNSSDISKDKYIDNTGVVDYTDHKFIIIVKDKDGNCLWRILHAYEHYENGEAKSPTIGTPELITLGEKKDQLKSHYISCDNTPSK